MTHETVVGGALEHAVVEDGHLLGSVCPTCGTHAFPPRSACWRDRSPMEIIALSGRGVVYEAVRIALPPTGFERPYWAAYVDLDEGPRMFAPLAWPEGAADPVHGDRVEARIAPVRRNESGDEMFGPVFSRSAS